MREKKLAVKKAKLGKLLASSYWLIKNFVRPRSVCAYPSSNMYTTWKAGTTISLCVCLNVEKQCSLTTFKKK